MDQLPATHGLSARQLAELRRIAEPDEFSSLQDALEETRNLVIGAVDGASPQEADFLADAARRYGNLSAYDPQMNPHLRDLLEARGIDPDLQRLHPGSITAFGHHVPYTTVLIPHPGPWINAARPDDLASCLEWVLGRSSVAYVLTDNEAGSGYATALHAHITETNEINVGRQEAYRPLQAEQLTLSTAQAGESVQLGGVSFTLGHQPNYRIVKISRA